MKSALSLSILALVLGCGAAEPVGRRPDVDDGANDESSAPAPSNHQTRTSILRAKISGVTVAPGCGIAVPSVAQSADGESMTMNFAQSLSGAQLSGVPNCRITLDIDVPEGYQFSFSNVVYKGYGLTNNFRRVYSWGPGDESRTSESPIPDASATMFACSRGQGADLEECFKYPDPLREFWSPSCRGTTHVQFAITLQPIVLDGEARFYLDSLDVATSMQANTSWRFCTDT